MISKPKHISAGLTSKGRFLIMIIKRFAIFLFTILFYGLAPAQDVLKVPLPDSLLTNTIANNRLAASEIDIPISMDLRMEKQAAGWKVYDVAIENVSLLENWRSQFNTQIQKNGVDGLIKALADLNKSRGTQS